MKYAITATATGEARDAEGNLVETVPIQHTIEVTREELEALGLPVPEENP